MSAYVVGTEHVDMLLTAAESYPRGPLTWWHAGQRHTLGPDTRDAVGAMLLATNLESVNRRYTDSEDAGPAYRFRRCPVDPTPVQVLKGIQCLAYQSDNVPDWEQTQAHAFLEALTQKMINNLAGYDAAPWEWTVEKVTR